MPVLDSIINLLIEGLGLADSIVTPIERLIFRLITPQSNAVSHDEDDGEVD